MCMFVAQLGTEGLAHQTIKCYLSAVRHYSIMAGQGDPFGPGAFPVLQYVLRGVRRAPEQPRLPVTPQILRHLKSQWTCHAGELKYMMLWAACCVGFFGFLRAGEFTSQPRQDFEPSSSLTPEDIAVDRRHCSNPSMVCIHLKCSKTDPFRHGVDIFPDQDLCPVAYMAVRPAVQGPLFIDEYGSPLTRDKLVTAV